MPFVAQGRLALRVSRGELALAGLGVGGGVALTVGGGGG